MEEKKLKFLRDWIGPWGGPQKEPQRLKFAPVNGSSLSEDEKKQLEEGGVVFHAKSSERTKVFVRVGPTVYGVTIKDYFLYALKGQLRGVGFTIWISDPFSPHCLITVSSNWALGFLICFIKKFIKYSVN